jgi:hypothetical protein
MQNVYGIQDQKQVKINAYPIPAKDKLIISGGGEKQVLIKIYDLNGHLIKMLPYNFDSSLFVGDLKNGIYLISIYQDDGTLIGNIRILKNQ